MSSLEPATLLERLRAMGFAPAAEGSDGAVVTAQVQARRAPERQRPAPLLAERPIPDDATLGAAVRAVRAGERSTTLRPAGAVPATLGPSASAQALAVIRQALEQGTPIWIGYVDHHGMTSERIVDPIRLEAGWLAAFDHRSGETRSFAVHRISGVADVDTTPAG